MLLTLNICIGNSYDNSDNNDRYWQIHMTWLIQGDGKFVNTSIAFTELRIIKTTI